MRRKGKWWALRRQHLFSWRNRKWSSCSSPRVHIYCNLLTTMKCSISFGFWCYHSLFFFYWKILLCVSACLSGVNLFACSIASYFFCYVEKALYLTFLSVSFNIPPSLLLSCTAVYGLELARQFLSTFFICFTQEEASWKLKKENWKFSLFLHYYDYCLAYEIEAKEYI